jgi:hypothetical protein
MNIIYISSSGNTYPLTTRRILTREANYFMWEYEPKGTSLMYGERVSYFHREPLRYETELIVRGSITQRKAILTALHDDFEHDVRTKQTGTLHFGEWYCNCYIVSSETTPLEEVNHWTANKIQIYIPSGFWVKDESKTFEGIEDNASEFLDYTYDYSYDYSASAYGVGSWTTDAPFESDFRMDIYGPVVNPRVMVNGYPYIVYATIAEGETLTIDSIKKTVMCGERNLFDARNKKQSVFEKIPSGNLSLTWGNFRFKLTLYEERSEPKW